MHEAHYFRFDSSIVMVIKFLTFRRFCSEQCSSAQLKIRALFIILFLYEEVFLFWADISDYPRNIFISEQFQNPHRLTVERFHRLE